MFWCPLFIWGGVCELVQCDMVWVELPWCDVFGVNYLGVSSLGVNEFWLIYLGVNLFHVMSLGVKVLSVICFGVNWFSVTWWGVKICHFRSTHIFTFCNLHLCRSIDLCRSIVAFFPLKEKKTSMRLSSWKKVFFWNRRSSRHKTFTQHHNRSVWLRTFLKVLGYGWWILAKIKGVKSKRVKS